MEFLKLNHNNNDLYIELLSENTIYQIYEFKMSNKYTKNVAKYKFIYDCYIKLRNIVKDIKIDKIIEDINFDKTDLIKTEYKFNDEFNCNIYIKNNNYEYYAYLFNLDNFIKLEKVIIDKKESAEKLINLQTKIKFPFNLGTILLNLSELKQIEIGDIILFDDYVGNDNCKISFKNYDYNFAINGNKIILK
jgi:hypothetical protein